jgi:hypothetical protein
VKTVNLTKLVVTGSQDDLTKDEDIKIMRLANEENPCKKRPDHGIPQLKIFNMKKTFPIFNRILWRNKFIIPKQTTRRMLNVNRQRKIHHAE